eukprot:1183046-Prorocentrum_minimum.AAC.2
MPGGGANDVAGEGICREGEPITSPAAPGQPPTSRQAEARNYLLPSTRIQLVRYGNIPTLPAFDWSVMGIYPRFLRPIGPSWEYTRASCVRLATPAPNVAAASCAEGVNSCAEGANSCAEGANSCAEGANSCAEGVVSSSEDAQRALTPTTDRAFRCKGRKGGALPRFAE